MCLASTVLLGQHCCITPLPVRVFDNIAVSQPHKDRQPELQYGLYMIFYCFTLLALATVVYWIVPRGGAL